MAATDRENRPDSDRDELFIRTYQELREIAGRAFAGERKDHTLQPTALVHEAYLKLKRQKKLGWADRTHFVALAAQAMRQVLIDFARRKKAGKRRAERVDWTISSFPQLEPISLEEFLALHQALQKLEAQPPNGARQARLIELVWLGGMEFTEAAGMLGISRRQAHRDWAWARTWLATELGDA